MYTFEKLKELNLTELNLPERKDIDGGNSTVPKSFEELIEGTGTGPTIPPAPDTNH